MTTKRWKRAVCARCNQDVAVTPVYGRLIRHGGAGSRGGWMPPCSGSGRSVADNTAHLEHNARKVVPRVPS